MYWTIKILTLSVFVISVYALKPVNIAKCCKFDENLTENNLCVKNVSSEWDIRIYNGKLKKFEIIHTLPNHWKIREGVWANCTRPHRLPYYGTNYFPFLNGSLYSIDFNQLFHPDKFCLDYKAVLICLNDSNEDLAENITHVIVKKCCGQDAIFTQSNRTCRVSNDNKNSYKIDIGPGKTLGAGFPPCEDNSLRVAGELSKSKLFDNGSIRVHGDYMLSAGTFCLEHILEHTSASIITCAVNVPRGYLEPTKSQQETDLRFTIYPIGLALSAIFLAATLAAGLLLPASHHVLHWQCQTNHVACLLVGDVLLCIVHLSAQIPYGPCFSIAVCMHFVFLAAFFWLNTMCFNIWWTFRDLRPQSTEKSQERLRLRLYEAYAWGIPLIIVIIAASLDLSSDPNYDILRPKFAENNCWFRGDLEKVTFFLGPMTTLLIINLILFGLTARELTCGLWKRELVKSSTERAALGLVCIKLVVVMGVSWIMDAVSWTVGGPHEIWYLTDFINSLHGVFIFIVVGCQPQVIAAVKRYWCLRKLSQNGNAGTTNHHSTSSQGPPSMGDTLTNTTVFNGNTKNQPLETTC